MYNVSAAFRTAIEEENDQKAMMIFGEDIVFTDMDIDVDRGIELSDFFNAEKDLAIGQTLSNELKFTVLNDDGYLNKFTFGEFTATIGVKVGEETYLRTGYVNVRSGRATYAGNVSYPFFMRNGTAVAVQPTFAVRSILCYKDKVYCFSDDMRYAVYDDKDGSNITGETDVNKFMRNKALEWDGLGLYYNPNSKVLFIYGQDGVRERYEFAPLGIFTAERPNIPDKIAIDFTCYDRMQLFDKDMPSDSKLGITYPITFENLLIKLCDYVGVPYALKSVINGTATLNRRPRDFDNATMRTVVGWIAEAACGNAKFNRDGELTIDWMHDTDVRMDEGSYETFDAYWYKTKTIDKLCNRDTQGGGADRTVGSGNNAYLIQDNPLLRGVS